MNLVGERGLMDATKQKRQVSGDIIHHVCICDLLVRVWIGVVTMLSIQLLLGKSSIAPVVKDIFRKEWRIVPQHSKAFAILMSFKGALTVQTDAAREPNINMTTVFRVARRR